MSHLMAWRNPQGKEENWVGRLQGIENYKTHVIKVISAEIGIALLLTTAIIETVVYSIFSLASLIVYPFTDTPYKFSAKQLQSCSFTILWETFALFANIFRINTMTEESFARIFAEIIHPYMTFYRLEDRLHVMDWALQNRHLVPQDPLLIDLFKDGKTLNEQIEQGAAFLKEHIIAVMDKETLSRFREMDPTLYMFGVTKSIFIYALGTKASEEPPSFFKPMTKKLLLDFRQDRKNKEVKEYLQRQVANPSAFDQPLAKGATQDAFNILRKIALNELQESLFSTRCWKRAAESIPN